jgi:hypothetical protein
VKKIALIIALLYKSMLNVAAQQPPQHEFKHGRELEGDSIIFPLTLVDAFPFVAAEVNGVKGKFMFDTGNKCYIEINDNMVNLPGKRAVRKGQVGSGQSFISNMNDTIAEIKFKNGLTYHNLLNITSANLDFLQDHITPDCIGYIGHDFFKGYLVMLDYVKRKITFYRITEDRKLSKDFLKGEKLLTVLNFETRRLPNHPMVHVKIGGVDFLGSFDTGQYGLIQCESQAAKVLKKVRLLVDAGLNGHGDSTVNVNNIIINGNLKLNVKGIAPYSLEQTTPFRKGMQITEANYICFGYRFFEQYKTVWDYDEKKIYVLEK